MFALATLAGCFQDSPPAVTPAEDAGNGVDVPVDQGVPAVDAGSGDTGPGDTGPGDTGAKDVGAAEDTGVDVPASDGALPADAGCNELSPCLDAGPADSGSAPDVGSVEDAGVDVPSVPDVLHSDDAGGGVDVVEPVDVPVVVDVPRVPPRRGATTLVLSSGGGEARSAGYALHAEIAYGAPAGGVGRGAGQHLYPGVVARP